MEERSENTEDIYWCQKGASKAFIYPAAEREAVRVSPTWCTAFLWLDVGYILVLF